MTQYVCNRCGKTFSLKGDYMRHLNRKNPCVSVSDECDNKTYECNYCHKTFTRIDNLKRHQNNNCHVMQSYDDSKEELFQLLLKERLERTKLSQQCEQLKKEIENCKNIINGTNNSVSHDSNNSPNANHNTIDGSHNSTDNSDNSTNTTNTTNNIQNTYNIKILPYGKEDLSHLTVNVPSGTFWFLIPIGNEKPQRL
jgi:DNA-directed RNA polymerase subunit RPC12/RpoP